MLFIDPTCPFPYSAATLASGFIGGTEATVVRVMSAMPEAAVMQHNRDRPDGAQFRPLDWSGLAQARTVVVLRSLAAALEVRQRGWQGPLYLWLHDVIDPAMALLLPHARQAGIELVAVSNWHRNQVLGMVQVMAGPKAPRPAIHVIYNPLDPSLRPSPIEPDPDRLAWISMSNKGVHEVLAFFQALRARYPQLELHVADPNHVNPAMPGVKILGLMTHAKAMETLASSFCMLCPNVSQPETFGIVYAEANALGVPALAHDFGAASEVLGDPRQLIDAYHPTELFDRFELWRREGRPRVQAREVFKLANVVQAWRALAA